MSLEMNKIAGAVLTAGVIAMGSGFVGDLLTHTPHAEEHAFVLAVATDDGGDGAAEAPTGPESVLPLLAAADLAAGEKVAKKCTACHTFDEGGANKIGPNLWNTVNRAVASIDGFGYSSALQDIADTSWSYEELDHFLANPKDYAPGTKMSFAGLKKVNDRAAMIAYMRSLSDAPAELPAAEEAAPEATEAPAAEEPAASEAPAEEAESSDAAASEAPAEETASENPAAEEAATEEATTEEAASEAPAAETAAPAETQVAATDAGGLGAAMAAATIEDGKKVSRKCKACHSFDKDGKHKIGPNLYGVIERGIGGAEGFNYSEALMAKSAETWNYDNLAAYLESPKTWAPGNKMAFAGLRKEKDRAAILVFLREAHDSPPDLPQ